MNNKEKKEIKTFLVVYCHDHQMDMAIITGENQREVEDSIVKNLGGIYRIKQIKNSNIFKLDKQKEHRKYVDMINS